MGPMGTCTDANTHRAHASGASRDSTQLPGARARAHTSPLARQCCSARACARASMRPLSRPRAPPITRGRRGEDGGLERRACGRRRGSGRERQSLRPRASARCCDPHKRCEDQRSFAPLSVELPPSRSRASQAVTPRGAGRRVGSRLPPPTPARAPAARRARGWCGCRPDALPCARAGSAPGWVGSGGAPFACPAWSSSLALWRLVR